MKKQLLAILMAAIVFVSFNTNDKKYVYYQMFMYNFTKYIQWPSDAQSGDFIVGVLGESAIIPSLEKMSSQKKVNGRSIVVKKFSSINDVQACHMLFIPEGNSGVFEEVMRKTNGSYTLLITEKSGLGKAGSAINFVVKSGKLKFELNKAATTQANLKVSGDLAKLAILI